MKNLAIFLFFIIAGMLISFAYFKLSPQTKVLTQSSTTPPPSGGPASNQNSFSLENAPSQSIRGEIATMSGNVEWEGRVATQAAKINSPQTIQQGESISTKEDGKVNLIFPTAVNLSIFPNTNLAIIQTLPVNIVFSQTKGIVDFTTLSSIPVSVRSHSLLVQLVEGEMILTVSDTTPFISLDIKKGSATAAYNDSQNVSQIIEVKKGERLVFNDDTRQAVLR